MKEFKQKAQDGTVITLLEPETDADRALLQKMAEEDSEGQYGTFASHPQQHNLMRSAKLARLHVVKGGLQE